MENLLNQIKEYQDFELNDVHYSKIKGTPVAGKKVTVQWIDRTERDTGYSFRLPNQDDDIDMLDICIHATHVDNSEGMDNAQEEWCHLCSLLSNDRIKSINFF